jgi:hypothetical protein
MPEAALLATVVASLGELDGEAQTEGETEQ